jgi:hypothetical protein
LAALSPVSLTVEWTRKKGRKEGASMAANLTMESKAPSFKLPSDGGGHISSAEFKVRRNPSGAVFAGPEAFVQN